MSLTATNTRSLPPSPMLQPREQASRLVLIRHHPTVRLAGLASITVTFLAASAAPTPLYRAYQQAWRFSDLTTTTVFGIYAVVLLCTLLAAGRLSDHIGRRPLLLAGVAGQIIALAVFNGAHDVGFLFTARVIQGVATGLAIGAVGAGMLDINPVKGAVANATAPGLGTGSGALLSAFAVQWLPSPTHLVYLVLIGLLVVQGAWVASLPETSPRRPGALGSLVPQVGLPPATRRAVVAAAPVLFAVWALGGFYASLGPSLIDQLAGSNSVALAGAGLGILALVGAVVTYVLRFTAPRRVMFAGAATLIPGVAAVLIAVEAGSVPAFLAATALAGVGFGAGFQGGIRLVAPLATPGERAGVLSLLYIVSYLGLGVPAVLAGLAVVQGVGLVDTTYWYGLAVILLAMLATANLIRIPAHTAKELIS
jgi:predicted MFS family arabinose efflux permease